MDDNHIRNTQCPKCGKELRLNENGRIGLCTVHKAWYAVMAGAEGEAAAKMAEEAQFKEQKRIEQEQARLRQAEEEQRRQHAGTMRKIAIVIIAILLIAVAVTFFIIKPSMTYRSAEEAFSVGNYTQAQEAFIGLGSYRDSYEKSILCEALIDLGSSDYISAIDKLDSLIDAGSSSSAMVLRESLIPVMAQWQANGIAPKAMLQLLTRREDIDPQHTLEYETLNVQAHAALLGSDIISYIAEDVDSDGNNELLVLNRDYTLSGYDMLADRNEYLRVDHGTASTCLMTLGDKQLENSIDNALGCYLEAYRLVQSETQRRRVVSTYQLRSSRHEAAGDTDAAIADSKSAMETGGTAEDFDNFYQTALRCCRNERDSAMAVQRWDDFISREVNALGRYGATKQAKLDAGAIRLMHADRLAKQENPTCMPIILEAAAHDVDVTSTIKDAIRYFPAGLTKIELRLMLGAFTPADRDAQPVKLSEDAKIALSDWRGLGLSGRDVLQLICLCDDNHVDLDELNTQFIYREAALQASGAQVKQSEFVDWDGDGYEELLIMTNEDELAYFAIDGEWRKKANYQTGLHNAAFTIRAADVPLMLVTSASADGLAVYGYEDGKPAPLFAETGILGCKIDGNHVSYERNLPGSIKRSETCVYEAISPQNRPQRMRIEWEQANYPYPASASATVLRWVEAATYDIVGEKNLLTAATTQTDLGFIPDGSIPVPANILDVSVAPYAVYDSMSLFEVTYATSHSGNATNYIAIVNEAGKWKMAGLSSLYSAEAGLTSKMRAQPLLALNEALFAGPLAKGKSANYRVLLPKASSVTMVWQAGQKKSNRTAFTVAFYHEDDLTQPIISYDLSLMATKQMSNPLLLPVGVYYVSVTATTDADEKYSLLLQAVANANIESESNDTADEADRIDLNTSYAASLIHSGDVDYFAFELTQPGKVAVTLNGDNEGKKHARYQLTVYDTASGAALMNTAMPGNVKKFQTANLYLGAGAYLMKITKGSYFSAAGYEIAVNYETVEMREQERNESPNTANTIAANTEIVGSFGVEGDVDCYVFTLKQDALVQPRLTFTPLETSSKTYVLTLLSANKQLMKVNVGGKESEKMFTPFALPSGTYVIQLENPNFTAQDYALTVLTQAVSDAESEPNNLLAEATVLPLNMQMTGVISGKDDVDIYKMVLADPVTVLLNFSFAPQSQSSTIFTVSLEHNGKAAWNANAKGTSGGIAQTLQFAPGEYYIRVKPSRWSSVPYIISAVTR